MSSVTALTEPPLESAPHMLKPLSAAAAAPLSPQHQYLQPVSPNAALFLQQRHPPPHGFSSPSLHHSTSSEWVHVQHRSLDEVNWYHHIRKLELLEAVKKEHTLDERTKEDRRCAAHILLSEARRYQRSKHDQHATLSLKEAMEMKRRGSVAGVAAAAAHSANTQAAPGASGISNDSNSQCQAASSNHRDEEKKMPLVAAAAVPAPSVAERGKIRKPIPKRPKIKPFDVIAEDAFRAVAADIDIILDDPEIKKPSNFDPATNNHSFHDNYFYLMSELAVLHLWN